MATDETRILRGGGLGNWQWLVGGILGVDCRVAHRAILGRRDARMLLGSLPQRYKQAGGQSNSSGVLLPLALSAKLLGIEGRCCVAASAVINLGLQSRQ